MSNNQPHLADCIRVRAGFLRSVHLERDFKSNAAKDYIFTECARNALDTVISAIADAKGRAMTLIGPYGAGKSAFCLSLARYFNDPTNNSYSEWLPAQPAPHLVPVLLVGSRQSLARALVESLAKALCAQQASPIVDQLQAECAQALAQSDPQPKLIAELFLRAASEVHCQGMGGLLLIIDELGKFLEYAALHPDDGDLFVLQELAEAAVRSESAPLLVIGVLHQNAAVYAQHLGRAQRMEWEKVAQRYREIHFFPTDLEQMDLIGRALSSSIPANKTVESLAEQWLALKLPHALPEERFATLAKKAYPLHPLCLLALPSLFNKNSQSNRSAFQFLNGGEPYALGRFMSEVLVNPAAPPLYTLDRLYDYAANVLLGAWSLNVASRIWADAIACVERADNLSPLAKRLLKCIALLTFLKEPRLPASPPILSLALTGSNQPSKEIAAALKELIDQKLIVLRKIDKTYRLWESGDVNIESELAKARSSLSGDITLRVAEKLCPPAPLPARRHSYRTGTARIICVRVCSTAKLQQMLTDVDTELTLIYCLASNSEEAKEAASAALALARPNILTAVALQSEALRETAAIVAAAEEVRTRVGELESDRAARKELAGRREEAEAAFREEWNRLFAPQYADTRWYYQGEKKQFVNQREFKAFLSTMADNTYSQAPILRNELVNRDQLSSAAAAGRRALIEAMLAHATEPNLGIRSFPPARSIYECILKATGLHQQVQGDRWRFAAPPEGNPQQLAPGWRALCDAVFAEPLGPHPVSELYSLLAAPPYGLTQGVLPIVLCAFLQAHETETTLYREGTFIPAPSMADYEVLLRRPELFAVAGCRVTGMRAAVVQRIAGSLGVPAATVPVTRALIQMVRRLPKYCWNSKRLPEKVLAVRHAFENAHSPEKLLFEALPAAVGVSLTEESAGDADFRIECFFKILNEVLAEWLHWMPRQSAAMRDALLQATGFPANESGWSLLQAEAAQLARKCFDPLLRPFLLRASMPGSDASLQSVLALLANRPPHAWNDADADKCLAQCQVYGQRYRQAREIYGLSSPLNDEARRWKEKIRSQLPADTDRHALKAALLALAAEIDRTINESGVEQAHES